ncbi:MbnP family protein [Echinicola shivajiensis]|uniref:MbnP family protein n=1 Tax=Echinicola shivajiensis TaxID=1035916 RepID=UPI001BFC92B5|nr:MbnP family protein [Echinicola shivajiensis]
MKKLAILLLAIIGFTACQNDDKDQIPAETEVNFSFTHLFNGEEVELENKSYTLPAGESFTPRKFKYYISNITFENSHTGASHKIEDGYFLIDQAGKKEFSVTLPTAEYDKLTFFVGIDKARNLSTDQVGDLDPNNDMVWNWNTGYKFLVLEGEWEYQSSDRSGLIVHIGNNNPENGQNFKAINIDLEAKGKNLGSNASIKLDLEVELSELFINPNSIKIHELENTSIMGGDVAIQIANNYQEGLFRLK